MPSLEVKVPIEKGGCMKRFLCVVLSAVLVLSVFSGLSFADDNQSCYGGKHLYDYHFIKGSSADSMVLKEESDFTREQLAVIILEIVEKREEAKEANMTPEFLDNESITWSAPYVAYCVKEGLMSGIPVEGSALNKFNPKGVVSGKQLATVIYRALGYQADWNTIMEDVEALGLSVENKPLKRGDAFNFIWDSVTKPICSDGTVLAVTLGKMTEEDIENISSKEQSIEDENKKEVATDEITTEETTTTTQNQDLGDGTVPLDDPEKVITFEDPAFEKAVREEYKLGDGEIKWKHVGYRTSMYGNGEDNYTLNATDLKWFVNLQSVYFTSSNIGGDLNSLSGMNNLYSIHWNSDSLGGDLSSLSGLNNLRAIELYSSDVSGDISSLSNLKNLETIGLTSSKISGDISAFSDLNNLTHIYLRYTKVSGDLSSLSNLENLSLLNLDRTKVSGDLSSLSDLKLSRLNVDGTNVTGSLTIWHGKNPEVITADN